MASTPPPATDGTALLETDLPLPGLRRGKVRDVYDLPAADDRPPAVLIVATDRISAFDVVMPTPVPGKGRLLTAVASRWFRWLESQSIISHHLLSTDPADVPGLTAEQARSLEGRIMIGRACRVVPVECVVRGYLAGSGWNDYEATGTVCGVPIAPGMLRAGQLPEPIFTPATKAVEGHDENIDFTAASAVTGADVMERLRDASIEIYRRAAAHASASGMLLADTKFEFGHALDDDGNPTDELIIIDEMLTQDSSRYWPADTWRAGEEPASFDKQFVRNHLLELVAAGRWDKTPPGPPLPSDVVAGTLDRYREAAERLFPGVTEGV
ncbi:MAG: phosphoribosylaminoimidazolesuccinocarboxamide synthase [Phycisphaerales bacterium]